MVKFLKRFPINFYPILCVASLFCARFYSLPIIPLLLCVVSAYFVLTFNDRRCRGNSGVKLVKAIGVYIFFSLLIYAIYGRPVEIFLHGLYGYVFPVAFFFLAVSSNDEEIQSFYHKTFMALMFTYIVGLYLYIVNPGWYYDWRASQLSVLLGDQNAENYIIYYKNLSSFFSHSYFVGFTAIWALSYVCNKIFTMPKISYGYFSALAIIILVELLAQQRASTVICVGIVVYYTVKEFQVRRFRITYLFIILIAALSYFVIRHIDELQIILERYMTILDLSVLSDGRDEQWKLVYKNFNNYLFGEGFNFAGHKARDYGFNSIADGEFFKDFYEFGILGFSILYIFFAATMMKAYKYRNLYMIELPVVVGFIALKYGANPFGMNNIIPLYWFSAGVVWRQIKKIKQFKQTQY